MRAHSRRLTVVLVSLGIAVAGCQRSASTRTQPADRNVLTAAQLGQSRFSTAYDAVQSLRPTWLTTRGTDSFQNPSVARVYLDNSSLGDKETLRSIAIQGVVFIRYYDGVSATARWGTNHGAGVIYVSTRPAGPGNPPL